MPRLIRLVPPLCLASLLSLASCRSVNEQLPLPPPSLPAPEYWPTEGWQTATPEAEGIDSERLAEALLSIREHRLDVHSVLLIRNGKIVADATLFPFSRQSVHDLASITKSVTATLVGVGVREGILDVRRPVLDYFPDLAVKHLDTSKRQVRVQDLLTMTSGLDCGRRPGEVELYEMISSPHWTRFALDLPVGSKPGASFAYCSPNFYLLSAILTRVTGETELAFARRKLFEPLGIREVIWPSGPEGLTIGWGDLHLLPRDVAKLGFLYLHGGQWDGRQILSPAWVETSARPLVQTDGSDAYSYGWWVSSGEFRGLYSARGRGGQYLFIWPKENLIAVFTGSGYDRDRLRPILAALSSDHSLPENPAGVRRLEQVVDELARPPAGASPASLPEVARGISGRTWIVEKSALGFRTISLWFDDGRTAEGTLETESGILNFTIGLDGVWRVSPGGRFGLPVASRGTWVDPTLFALEVDETANINHWLIEIRVGSESTRPPPWTPRAPPASSPGAILMRVTERTGRMSGEVRLRGVPAP